jgi:hypothetical protein
MFKGKGLKPPGYYGAFQLWVRGSQRAPPPPPCGAAAGGTEVSGYGSRRRVVYSLPGVTGLVTWTIPGVTPGCQIGYMDHTGCHVDHTGCQ